MRLAYVLASLSAVLLLGSGDAVAQRIAPPHVPPPHIAPPIHIEPPRIEPLPRTQPLPRAEPLPRLQPLPRETYPQSSPRPNTNGYPSTGGSGAYGSGASSYTYTQPALPSWPDSYAYDFARRIVGDVRANNATLGAHMHASIAGIAIEAGDIPIAVVSEDVLRSAIFGSVSDRIAELSGRYAYTPSNDSVVQFVQGVFASDGVRIAYVAADAGGAVGGYDSVVAALDGVVGAGGPLGERTIVVSGADRRAIMTSIPKDEVALRGRPAFLAPEDTASSSDAVASGAEVLRELRPVIDRVRHVGASEIMVIDLMPRRTEDARAWGFADYEARRYADVGARLKPKLAQLAAAGVDVRRPRSRDQFWRVLQQAQSSGRMIVIIGESNVRNGSGRARRIVQIPGTKDVVRPRDFHGLDKSRLVGLFCHSREVLGGDAAGGFDTMIMGRDAIRGVEAVRIALNGVRLVLPVDSRPDTGRDVDDSAGGSPVLHIAYEFMHAFDDATAAAGGGGDGDPPQTWTFRAFAVDRDDDDGGPWGFIERMWWRLMGIFAGRDEGR